MRECVASNPRAQVDDQARPEPTGLVFRDRLGGGLLHSLGVDPHERAALELERGFLAGLASRTAAVTFSAVVCRLSLSIERGGHAPRIADFPQELLAFISRQDPRFGVDRSRLAGHARAGRAWALLASCRIRFLTRMRTRVHPRFPVGSSRCRDNPIAHHPRFHPL